MTSVCCWYTVETTVVSTQPPSQPPNYAKSKQSVGDRSGIPIIHVTPICILRWICGPPLIKAQQQETRKRNSAGHGQLWSHIWQQIEMWSLQRRRLSSGQSNRFIWFRFIKDNWFVDKEQRQRWKWRLNSLFKPTSPYLFWLKKRYYKVPGLFTLAFVSLSVSDFNELSTLDHFKCQVQRPTLFMASVVIG